jgi:hypothetical protein
VRQRRPGDRFVARNGVSISIILEIRYWGYLALIICCGTLLLPACGSQRNSVAVNSNSQRLAATPPFSTQEPTRYQAVRTITSSNTGSSKPSVTRSKVARDGSMRREEYETARGDILVYLEIPAGRFVLLPSVRLIADLREVSPPPIVKDEADEDVDLSVERLLNQTVLETRYDLLGPETVNGRGTTKYRVLPKLEEKGSAANSETLIWIDDTLRIPIRWEANAKSGEGQTRTVMELSEISLTVDARIFALPANYRKVNSRLWQDRIGNGQTPKSTHGKN